MKYQTKALPPLVVDAQQWFKNGDHSEDNQWMVDEGTREEFLSEGAVVRYYLTPGTPGTAQCLRCPHVMQDHGWLDTPGGGQAVCPGDWILTDARGKRHPCKPQALAMFYESVPEETAPVRREDTP